MSYLEIKVICFFLTIITFILLLFLITIVNLVITVISIHSNPVDWETCDGGKNLRIFVLGSFFYTLLSILITTPSIMTKLISNTESRSNVTGILEVFCFVWSIWGIVIINGSAECKSEDQSLYYTALVSLLIHLGRWGLILVGLGIGSYFFVIYDVNSQQQLLP